MNTVSQIFNYIKSLNAKSSTVSSSIGAHVSESSQQVADMIFKEVKQALTEGTTAYSILVDSSNYSDKQLWCIAYALEKNEAFVSMVVAFNQTNKSTSSEKKAYRKQKETSLPQPTVVPATKPRMNKFAMFM